MSALSLLWQITADSVSGINLASAPLKDCNAMFSPLFELSNQALDRAGDMPEPMALLAIGVVLIGLSVMVRGRSSRSSTTAPRAAARPTSSSSVTAASSRLVPSGGRG